MDFFRRVTDFSVVQDKFSAHFTTDSQPSTHASFKVEDISKRDNSGVVYNVDFDPDRETVVYCQGRTGNYHNARGIPNEIMEKKGEDGKPLCNVIFIKYRAPGNANTAIADAKRAVTYMIQKKGVNPEKMHFAGHSFGCLVASELALEYPQARSLIAITPPPSMHEAARTAAVGYAKLLVAKRVDGYAGKMIAAVIGHTFGVLAKAVIGVWAKNRVDIVKNIQKLHQAPPQKGAMPVFFLTSLYDVVVDNSALYSRLERAGLMSAVGEGKVTVREHNMSQEKGLSDGHMGLRSVETAFDKDAVAQITKFMERAPHNRIKPEAATQLAPSGLALS
jgi:pimeloyl-ACP methyl ester carboxylesterase